MGFDGHDLDRFAQVANRVADAAGEVIRKYFRKKFEIIDKADFSMWFAVFEMCIGFCLCWRVFYGFILFFFFGC